MLLKLSLVCSLFTKEHAVKQAKTVSYSHFTLLHTNQLLIILQIVISGISGDLCTKLTLKLILRDIETTV